MSGGSMDDSTKFPLKWELPVLVIISLFLQLVLIALGKWRKCLQGNFVTSIIWLAYLTADAIATLSLGILARAQNNSEDGNGKSDVVAPEYVIRAFWAPFLLLHLGGPDTITAYALEDNELWLRHLLGLLIQTGVTGYVFYKSLDPTPLNFVSIPVYVAGLIKYGERTWALWSASSGRFRDMMLPKPDAGPNYPKFVQLYSLRESEGYKPSLEKFGEKNNGSTTTVVAFTASSEAADAESGIIRKIPEAEEKQERIDVKTAYGYFIIFKRLFADLILSFGDLQKSQKFFQSITESETAFKLIEIELGFVFDLLFTKAGIAHSSYSWLCRCISILATVAALVAFCLIDRHDYSTITQIVSFLLLCGAICLEIYALLLLIFSDWMLLWLGENAPDFGLTFFSSLRHSFPCRRLRKFNKKRWSGRVGQYNLLTSSFKDDEAKCCCCFKRSWFKKIKEMFVDDHQWEAVSDKMKTSVFDQLRRNSSRVKDYKQCREECSYKGAPRLVKESSTSDDFKLEYDVGIEIDHCIILWHIATELIFYKHVKQRTEEEVGRTEEEVERIEEEKGLNRTSRLLSHYMMFLVVKRPLMLPDGIGEIRVRDTRAEAREFIRDYSISDDKELATCLLKVDCNNDNIPTGKVKGDRSKAVLFDACTLAHRIINAPNTYKEKWEIVEKVWIEILCYVASRCRWNHHAQQLRRGGEWLTHVWLLMAHLAITEQCQISQGHARIKLELK